MSEEERDDLHALYQACVTDLSFFKAQQWSITNYTLIAYGALFAATEVIRNNECWIKVAFAILAISVGISDTFLILSLRKAIMVRQARLAIIREKLTPIFREAWGAMEKGDEFVNPVLVLLIASWVAAVLVVLLITFGPWKI